MVKLSESVKRGIDFNLKSFQKMVYVEVLPVLNARELVSYEKALVSVVLYFVLRKWMLICWL